MSLIADGVLIATCLTTALYCLILSRRLHRLSNTGEGVGQQILRLNTALTETRAAVEEIRSSAGLASDQLQRDVETAKLQSHRLQLQIARALKSAASSNVAPRRMASGPADDRSGMEDGPGKRREISEARDWAVSLEPADEGEASDSHEDELDDSLRAADAWDADVDVSADDAATPTDDTAEYVGTGDVSEAENHWPFDGPDGETAEVEDPSDPPSDDSLKVGPGYSAGVSSGTVQPRDSSTERGVRPASSETGETGPLRVERMAV